jgi:hypothetical protein
MKDLCIKVFLIAVAVSALIVAGCGDDDDSSGDQGNAGGAGETTAVQAGSLSKNEFIKRADAICTATIDKRDADFPAYAKRNDIQLSRAEFLERASELANEFYVPRYRKQLEDLRALGVPKGDEEEIEEIFNAMEQTVDEIQEQPKAFVLNPNPFGPISEAAREYGFKICAEAYFKASSPQ